MRASIIKFALAAALALLAAPGYQALAAEPAGHKGHAHGADAAKTAAVENPAECQVCGMDRNVFAASRVVVSYQDGSSAGTCSINCAREVVDRNPGKKIKAIRVSDYDTKKLIDAKKAVWVIGGKKAGVMSAVAKWAFTTKAGAEGFVRTNGGKIAGFDEAWKAAAQ
jgi:copper chaperone NosL